MKNSGQGKKSSDRRSRRFHELASRSVYRDIYFNACRCGLMFVSWNFRVDTCAETYVTFVSLSSVWGSSHPIRTRNWSQYLIKWTPADWIHLFPNVNSNYANRTIADNGEESVELLLDKLHLYDLLRPPRWARINGVLLYREGPNLWHFRVPLAFSSSNPRRQAANDRSFSFTVPIPLYRFRIVSSRLFFAPVLFHFA